MMAGMHQDKWVPPSDAHWFGSGTVGNGTPNGSTAPG